MGFIFDQYRKRQEFKFKGLGVTQPQAFSLKWPSLTPAKAERQLRKLRKKEKKDAKKS